MPFEKLSHQIESPVAFARQFYIQELKAASTASDFHSQEALADTARICSMSQTACDTSLSREILPPPLDDEDIPNLDTILKH